MSKEKEEEEIKEKKFKISNPARFWLGVSFVGFEVLGLAIFGLTLLDWSWFTQRVVLIALVILGIVLYNIIAGMLIYNGSKKK